MKKIISNIVVIILVIITNSCTNDFLDLERENSPAENEWKSTRYVYRKMASLYAPYQKMYDRGYFFFICASDDMVTGRTDNEKAQRIKDFILSGDESYISKEWDMRYRAIRTANEIIANIDRVKNMLPKDKNMFLGESYFTLGFMYFELAYHYGNQNAGVPIVSYNSGDKVEPRATTIIKNFEYIEKSLLKAAELLPYFDPSKNELKDRAHKTAALAYLAKTYLYWAKYDKSKYAKAVETANKIINSGRHDLIPDYKKVFYINNNYGSEYIWSVASSASLDQGSILPGALFENKGWDKKKYPNSPSYNGWGYFQPTKELYDSYQKGDKRREATLFKEGDKFIYFGKDWTWTKTSYNYTGFMFAKYIQPFADEDRVSKNGDHPCTDLNVPLMRYAEVLLIKAEALIADGKNGDMPLNKIRNRAGLPNISGATMDDLKRERRCELAGEFADRHFDLVRWGDAQKTYAKPLHGMVALKDKAGNVMKDAGGNIIFKVVKVWDARTFNPSIHNVWPIPPSVINKSGDVIKQNNGYAKK